MAFQRARQPEQKAERQQTILDAASCVLDRDGIDATSLNAIAQAAGLAKSNIYRYFESREDILMHLMMAEAESVIEIQTAKLRAHGTQDDFAYIGRSYAETCAAHPRFCLLISQMGPILERNISVERIIEMKLAIAEMLHSMAQEIHRAAPALGPDGAMEALHIGSNLVSGLWPMHEKTDTMKEAMKHPDLAWLDSDFQETVARAMTVYMTGLTAMREQDAE